MNKLEKILIYVPIIGIIVLIYVLNSDNVRYEKLEFEDVSTSVSLQTISVIFLCAIIGLFIDKIVKL